jgi:hypothetical protein
MFKPILFYATRLPLYTCKVDYYRGTMNRALLKSRAVQISDSFLARAAKQPLRFNDESLRQVAGVIGVGMEWV